MHSELRPADGLAELMRLDEDKSDGSGSRRLHGGCMDLGTRHLFGGQLLGQAIAAAQVRTATGQAITSLHALFLEAGDGRRPVAYAVESVRDGRSSHVRRVDAWQGEAHLMTALVSFHASRDGVVHADAMPDVPPPEDLASEDALLERALRQTSDAGPSAVRPQRPIELRPVRPWNPWRPEAEPEPPCTWLRARAPLPADPALHRALIGYVSDYTLLRAALRPHGLSFQQPGVRGASLDHALWIHADARLDEWLLYCSDSPQAAGGRALARGSLFTRDGRLVASVAQEGIVRHKEKTA